MKTKSVMPWKLKVGQKLVTYDFNYDYNPVPVIGTILSIIKRKGYFTGASIWEVRLDNHWGTPLFHGQSKSLKPDKATIVVDN